MTDEANAIRSDGSHDVISLDVEVTIRHEFRAEALIEIKKEKGGGRACADS